MLIYMNNNAKVSKAIIQEHFAGFKLQYQEEIMKALIIMGSRNPDGQTARAADGMIQGMNISEIEQFFLPRMKIDRCRQCDNAGWGICRTKGECVIKDDFASLVDKIKGADVVAFVTPVYFGDLSESLKTFLDRLRRTCMHESGKENIAGKKCIGICVAGGGGGGAPSCTVSMEKVLRTCGFDIVDLVPVRRQNLEMKVEVLKITGKWLIED
ncbi:hypothetical protein GF312_22175 [Candidatus Poribacteria bacterium]|nr:hypothetical protein [Candidatus Poribacteria bacterium]